MRKNSVNRRAFRLYNAYNPRYFPLEFLRIVFENLAPYFTLWMSAEVVSALYEGRRGRQVYGLIAAALLGNLVIRVLGAVFSRAAKTARQVLENNQAAAFNAKTLSLDYDKLENPDIRQHRRRIVENAYINNYGVEFMRQMIVWGLESGINVALSLVLLVEMLGLMAAIGWNVTAALLLLALIALLAAGCVMKSVTAKKTAAANERIGSMMLEENRLARGYHVNGMDNRLYRQNPLLDEIHGQTNKKHLECFSWVFRLGFRLSIPKTLIDRTAELCVYLLICLYCTLGAFPVGSIIKYVGVLGRLSANLQRLLTLGQEAKSNLPFLQTYLDYFDIKNEMYQGSLSVEKRSDRQYEVVFKDVSFRYPGASVDALQHIDLSLQVGQRLAVVGENGSGKTTFIKLLCRLYDPTAGEILMNDFNIRKYDYRQYLDLFSVVFQDYRLLSVSLGSNVAGAAQWDTEKAERLLQEVGFGERYAQLPAGLETPLYRDFDEDGVNVSGGEAQKIALARALYRNAPFIILDEPTAALDPLAEAEIYARFDEIVSGKTAIYISHRLSSCRFCDKIAVFDAGRLVQVGTHEELLAQTEGKYYALWHAQAQYYN